MAGVALPYPGDGVESAGVEPAFLCLQGRCLPIGRRPRCFGVAASFAPLHLRVVIRLAARTDLEAHASQVLAKEVVVLVGIEPTSIAVRTM